MYKQKLKIKESDILLFDMDGTLIDTDYANFLSYKKALKPVIGINNEILFNSNERFTRTSLKSAVPDLTETEYEKIIQKKEVYYKEYLSETKLNESVVDILLKYFKTNQTVLVTNCRKDRALMTLKHHKLKEKFNHILFRNASDNGQHINKYLNAITKLNLSTQKVIVFENERTEIEDAILAGIPINKIISL
ncbi:HAD hydrolase-like protein [Salinimicrobium sp. TIG7-5_MAKvit]|uniref:HAD hydrolase-like protein n=1 Tax=Salinimicrobium sp. TIG7-5_MAKvit TaxID=3121289 RepID=UPI003C6DF581